MFKDLQLFFKEFKSNFISTGAIAPSSPQLARAILKPIRKRPSRPIKVLEVGPGTGAFTFEILKLLKVGDTLHIYELNEKLFSYLNKKIAAKLKGEHRIDVQLLHTDIRTLKSGLKYDYIISSLPFVNFDSRIFCEIMDNYFRHLAPEGIISYFDYILPHRLRLQFLKPGEHQRVKRLLTTMKSYLRRHQVAYDHVWLNLPPASARHLKKPLYTEIPEKIKNN
jgi:phospholipid N-methyltransferase